MTKIEKRLDDLQQQINDLRAAVDHLSGQVTPVRPPAPKFGEYSGKKGGE